MHSSQQWWDETKADPSKLSHWLRRQYVGEIAAVNLLSEVLLRFGGSATAKEWDNVHRVMLQEATHAKWMKQRCDARGIVLDEDASAERRYWKEVLPNVTNFREAMAAAYHAEHMRLERIRIIAADRDPAVADLAETFSRILPHEQWHEEVFGEMMKGGSEKITRYHERGLEALNLTLQ
jgi:rubrerythrin